MGTISCHSNQSSYPTGTKKHLYSFPHMLYVLYEKNRIHGFRGSRLELLMTDGQRKDKGYLYIL